MVPVVATTVDSVTRPHREDAVPVGAESVIEAAASGGRGAFCGPSDGLGA